MDAGQDRAVPGRGLDARYEQLRHAALHTRADAFPLGLTVLTGGGVTAWQRALAQIASPAHPPTTAPTSSATPPATVPALPGRLDAELVHALAAVALAGTVPAPPAPLLPPLATLAQGDPHRCPPTPPRRR